jgi:hypothetical protein
LHALTLPRSQPNSRLKDLVDIALLSDLDGHEASLIGRAIERTFRFRASHGVPIRLPEPPIQWAAQYARMQRDEQLNWATLDDVLRAARALLDPVLAGTSRRWHAPSALWLP